MIADPVALLVRTSSQFASFGRAYFIPDHEEGRANGSAREHVENETRGFGLGAVIKCERKIQRCRSLSCSGKIAVSLLAATGKRSYREASSRIMSAPFSP